jgi:hypothetical protein
VSWTLLFLFSGKLLLASSRFVDACQSVFHKTAKELLIQKKELWKDVKKSQESIKTLQKHIGFINKYCIEIKYLLQNPLGTILTDD